MFSSLYSWNLDIVASLAHDSTYHIWAYWDGPTSSQHVKGDVLEWTIKVSWSQIFGKGISLLKCHSLEWTLLQSRTKVIIFVSDTKKIHKACVPFVSCEALLTHGIAISKPADGSQLICGWSFVGNQNSVVTTQNSQALSFQAKGHFPLCQDSVLKAKGPLQPALQTRFVKPTGKRMDECGGKWPSSLTGLKLLFIIFSKEVQLDQRKLRKREKKVPTSVQMFTLEHLSQPNVKMERSIATVWKPKLHSLTSAYIGFHAITVNLTHGTRGEDIYSPHKLSLKGESIQ